ncbi:hypothetical protein PGTUg99_031648 [Puccinia graminis f. sp. tritici]|uniref:Uncharacterized protein n=1 Tax=Puccinia graminis f. sp. tritici TaxID=56615 RepID=A0A5B0SFZ0_PUCGR|nr:hypothetical protein PGTUg99_031648 [Puccinia graminis f. sp. tritici]
MMRLSADLFFARMLPAALRAYAPAPGAELRGKMCTACGNRSPKLHNKLAVHMMFRISRTAAPQQHLSQESRCNCLGCKHGRVEASTQCPCLSHSRSLYSAVAPCSRWPTSIPNDLLGFE